MNSIGSRSTAGVAEERSVNPMLRQWPIGSRSTAGEAEERSVNPMLSHE
jgi:hypothetical protein